MPLDCPCNPHTCDGKDSEKDTVPRADEEKVTKRLRQKAIHDATEQFIECIHNNQCKGDDCYPVFTNLYFGLDGTEITTPEPHNQVTIIVGYHWGITIECKKKE